MILKLCDKIDNENENLVNWLGQSDSNFRKLDPEQALHKNTSMELTALSI